MKKSKVVSIVLMFMAIIAFANNDHKTTPSKEEVVSETVTITITEDMCLEDVSEFFGFKYRGCITVQNCNGQTREFCHTECGNSFAAAYIAVQLARVACPGATITGSVDIQQVGYCF